MATLAKPHCPWIIEPLRCEIQPPRAGWLQGLIGEAPEAVAAELKSRDFAFLAGAAIRDRTEIVAGAERLIDRVPSLGSVVRGIVRQVFLLGAREEYDVSHSEPRWPNWIFVSAPRSAGVVSSLRLAENVVHEAMHLQLTELEGRMPLVADRSSRLQSPWKQEPRQLQGILHGLYVCACISAFFRSPLRDGWMPQEGIDHIDGRIASIVEEVRTVPMGRLDEGLTEAGRQFLKSIET